MASYDQKIKAAINGDKIVMYSKTYCPYCKMAKSALKGVNATFKAIELDEMNDGADYQNALQAITGVRSVPQVFIGGKYVGGGTDMKKLHDSGKLATMVA
uniref:Glutaredoxin-2, mitochondrial n=1 Tax=Phallusia mammillata TaxID=59560 RepID=A0A6F9DEC3_9ASCI|nr:monothiol glutaredoxin-S6-like [Phallusia mammillata]